ncbi:hydrogenase maturation protease [Microbulbifer donghaiensis]|uniref:Hydrogenase maturation protease n=1 Tax=Microbulbifer donghaiensis TaxID=494016 RepID=A0A1M4UPF5_9GAMM|nr:hydrogenase maturation protease [Microbulbifer donghaiensis]SHE58596.1 hydrogenase maturation protease [Microbulbifer donghaiensis]
MNWAIISLGNRFRGDDGIGPLVLDKLRERFGRALDCIENGGDMTQLLEDWRERHVCVVDAVVLPGRAAGDIIRLDGLADPPLETVRTTSSHGLDLAEAIELGRALGALPLRMDIYAICGENFATGAALTADVAAAAGRVARSIAETLVQQTGGPFCTSNP